MAIKLPALACGSGLKEVLECVEVPRHMPMKQTLQGSATACHGGQRTLSAKTHVFSEKRI